MNSSANKWCDYPAAVLKAAPEQVAPALAAHYEKVTTADLGTAYTCLARSVAIFEETPRGTLGAALRQHLGIVAAELRQRGEVVA